MSTRQGRPAGRRQLRFGVVLTLVAGGAALAAIAAAVTWAAGTGVDDLRGPIDVSAAGSRVAPALVPVAAASIAALGALLAARGVLRRAVGALIVVLGAVVGWLGIRGLLHEPSEILFASTPSVSLADVGIRPFGPLLAVLGGVALLAAGLAVVTDRIRARELSARYERGGTPAATARTSEDPALEMWRALDGHRDPTLDRPAPTARGRVDRAPDNGPPDGERLS